LYQIGIMQGRLLPPHEGRIQCFPREHWAQEFPFAKRAGIAFIEWIYDEYGEDVNPLNSEEALSQLQALAREHGVAVPSMCADLFMERPFLKASGKQLTDLQEKLCWLVDQGKKLGIKTVTLPFVDNSKIENEDQQNAIAEILKMPVKHAEKAGVEIHIESSLGPQPFAEFLDKLPYNNVKVNYDSGNSSSLGYDPKEEFAAYAERVGSVHIKDRVRGGGTVPLGTGDADLPAVFRCLIDSGYRRNFVLQVARSEPGQEVAWATQNRLYCEEQLRNLGVACEETA